MRNFSKRNLYVVLVLILLVAGAGIVYGVNQAQNKQLFSTAEVLEVRFLNYTDPTEPTVLQDAAEVESVMKLLNHVRKANFTNENSDMRNPTHEGEIRYRNRPDTTFSIWLDNEGEPLLRKERRFFYLQTDREILKEIIQAH